MCIPMLGESHARQSRRGVRNRTRRASCYDEEGVRRGSLSLIAPWRGREKPLPLAVISARTAASLLTRYSSLGTTPRVTIKRQGGILRRLKLSRRLNQKPEGSNSAGNMRGVKPLHCKGCGEPFANVPIPAKHKPVCPGAVSKGPAEAAQATPA